MLTPLARVGSVSFLLMLSACQATPSTTSPQVPGSSPSASASPVPSPSAVASASPDPLQPSPAPSATPTASASPVDPASLPAGLASLRFAPDSQRFLDEKGQSTTLRVEGLDASAQVLSATLPLNWTSSRPQDFSVSPDGTVVALVDNGFSEIRASIPGTSLSTSLVMNVSTAGSGGSGGGGSNTPATPVLRLLADSGFSGDTVVISGSGFSRTPQNNLVRFGEVLAIVTEATPTRLTLKVPDLPSGTFSVSVENDGQSRTVGDFRVRTLALTSFSPASGAAGTQITLSGEGFDGASRVAFNGVDADFTVNSDTQITVTVPLTATDGVITVGNGAAEADSSAFDVLRTIFVNDDAPGLVRDGFRWSSAYHNLDTALNAASAGDQIWMAAGTYKPSASDVNVAFQMKANVNIYGGFEGDETNLSAADPETHLVRLSGDLQDDDVTSVTPFTSTTPNSTRLINGASNAILSGVTLSGATNSAMYLGGVSPSLQQLVFEHNQSAYGGGIRIQSGSPTLSNVVFRHNYASVTGGGVSSFGSSNVTLTNVDFEQNEAANRGGGFHQEGDAGSCTLTDVRFQQNKAIFGAGIALFVTQGGTLENVVLDGNEGGGGGSVLEIEGLAGSLRLNRIAVVNNTAATEVIRFNVYTDGATARVSNMLVADNVSEGSVLNIQFATTNGVGFQHVTLANNLCDGSPCAIRDVSPNDPTYQNLLFWKDLLGSSPGVSDSNLAFDAANDPFVDSTDPDGPDNIWFTEDDGFQLKSTVTTAIDAGVVINDLETDITDRDHVGTPDIGAYEYITP
ncbi:MAG: IPT/TIG domain-containing protein [Candidatus Sericytochromatia bacterium]